MTEVQTENTTEEEVIEVKEVAKKDKKAAGSEKAYWTVGRRKEAIARIKMSLGKGEITINDKPIEEAYPHALEKSRIMMPLVVVDRQDTFDISIKVAGGGPKGQLGAISLGIARALKEYDDTLRATLREHGLLTRDQRMKERKKYGLKRARKAPQFSKR